MSITDLLVAVGTIAVPILTFVIWRSQKAKLHLISYKVADSTFSIETPPFISEIISSDDTELKVRLAANRFVDKIKSSHITHVIVTNELKDRSPEFTLEVPTREAWLVKVDSPFDQANSSVTSEILINVVQVRFAFLEGKRSAHVWVFSEGFGGSIVSLASGQVSLDRRLFL